MLEAEGGAHAPVADVKPVAAAAVEKRRVFVQERLEGQQEGAALEADFCLEMIHGPTTVSGTRKTSDSFLKQIFLHAHAMNKNLQTGEISRRNVHKTSRVPPSMPVNDLHVIAMNSEDLPARRPGLVNSSTRALLIRLSPFPFPDHTHLSYAFPPRDSRKRWPRSRARSPIRLCSVSATTTRNSS